MELAIGERIELLKLLPQASDFITLKIVQEMREQLGFSDEELTQAEIKENKAFGTITWQPEKGFTRDVNFGPAKRKVLADALVALDAAKALSPIHLRFYEEFVVKVGDVTEIDVVTEAESAEA